uniref:Uncharacterized protein n=1 Tax=Populus alba TaxID=43335 RepID=A0A4U5R1I2_POPAL|nr:hypothetical protein D5086_0000029220 [Populus alba]
MRKSIILRIKQIIVNFFIWIYSFRSYFIRNNVVLKAYCFLQCPNVLEENREQIGKSLLNRFVAKYIAVYFNPTGLCIRPFEFFLLEKRDPLCGVVKPYEELSRIVLKVYRPRWSEKSGDKEISGKLDSDMI